MTRQTIEEKGEPGMPTASYPLHRRVVDTFVAPQRLGAGLAAKPVWAAALALVVIASSSLSLMTTLGARGQNLQIAMARETQRLRGQDAHSTMSADWPAQYAARAPALLLVSSILGAPFGLALVAALTSGLLSRWLAGLSSFKVCFAAAAHASVITFVGGFINGSLRLATGDPFMSLSIAALVPIRGPANPWWSLLSMLSPFGLWGMVAYGLVISGATKRPAWQAVCVALGVHLVFGVFSGGAALTLRQP